MEETKGRVCVTGAGGYVASWLVKLLLSNGYTVHGTVRDPSHKTYSHLNKFEKAGENLQVFKAELLDYSSLASAIGGCEGVFHVASPILGRKLDNPEEEIIAPAVTGTLNVLRACSEAKVKRVVLVSSIAAVARNPSFSKGVIMDENCWSDKEFCCRTTEDWYSLSKTQAESEAIDYGKRHGLDVITLCPSLVIGRFLQSTVNASSLFFANMLKARECMENKIWNFVDVRDVADALLLVYEKPEASGRYICAPHTYSTRDIVEILKSKYPNYKCPKEYTEVEGLGLVSSEKLKKLGWNCRPIEESVIDSVDYYHEVGILDTD